MTSKPETKPAKPMETKLMPKPKTPDPALPGERGGKPGDAETKETRDR